MNAQAKRNPSARTIFGGAVTDGRPVATITLIGLCAVIYAGQLFVPSLTESLWLVPSFGAAEPWRFVTSAFVHSSNPTHILFNMYALWIMGTYLEPMLGRARFVALYLLSAFGGSVFFVLLAAPPTMAQLAAGHCGMWCTPVVGASGAVFGLFGGFVVLQHRLGWSAAGMWAVIGINVVIGFLIPGIAWQGHLGGFLTGVAGAGAIAYLGRRQPVTGRAHRARQWLGLAGIFVLLLVAIGVKYATVPAFALI
ncbi:MAG: rhomboid family intramembrane serine protease [Actinomycetales bacterium]